MISVRERVIHDIPSLFKGKLLLINKDSEKFHSRDCWMSVVQLNLVEFSKSRKLVALVVLFVVPDDIVEGGRAEEVLLLEPKLLSSVGGVVWVEDTGDVLGVLPV